jgi:NAD(P)-dependent dehydrogenase (short-subunit alcohol dehydrogenase family)
MRIFITGSADGLGLMAAQLLIGAGHQVVLHARSAKRLEQALAAVTSVKRMEKTAVTGVYGDLGVRSEVLSVAEKVNQLGRMDAVIHNAGVGYREPRRIETVDGVPHVLAVNTLAPYMLTALIEPPARLVYLSSGLHTSGDASLEDLTWVKRAWHGTAAYSDSKLHDVLIAFAVARRWPSVTSNALEPGWVATKMGGPQAPDDLSEGPKTQVWLATSDDAAAKVSGRYFFHGREKKPLAATQDERLQERMLKACEALTGISLPAAR